ncbi:MAG: alternative ribosome rescue aminoacyl-tRNA hydrolase ArfB [Myxococcota bacterium]
MAARRGDGARALPGGNRIPTQEIEELASRASGPGGQHVNTSSTRVSLRWNLRTSAGLTASGRQRLLERLAHRLSREGVLTIHADRHRSRRRNLEEAHDRLYEIVRTALYQAPPRRPTKPGRGAVERRLKEKRRRSDVKRNRRARRDDD